MLNRMTSEEEESVSGKVTFRELFKKISDLSVWKPLNRGLGFSRVQALLQQLKRHRPRSGLETTPLEPTSLV